MIRHNVVATIIGLAALGLNSDQGYSQGRRLELTEAWSTTIPAGWAVAGGTFLNRDRVAVWSPLDSAVLIVSPRLIYSIGDRILRSPPQIVSDCRADRLCVLDSAASSLVTFSSTGQLLQSIRLPTGSRILFMNSHEREPLVIRQVDTLGHLRVERLSPGDGHSIDSHAVTSPVHLDPDLFWFDAGSSSAVQVSYLRHPFSSWTFDPATGNLAPVPPIPAPLASRLAEDSLAWAGLRSLPLDQGFLRTFSHLKSDRRIVAVFDSSHVLLRTLELDVPMAFIASSTEHSRLLAVRYTDRTELVVYEWRWVHHPNERE